MEKMIEFGTWIIANKVDILQMIANVIAITSVIVKLTPTLKDDNIFLPIVKFLGKYIALNTNAPVERPK